MESLAGRGRGGGSVKGKKVDVKIFPVVYMLCLMSEGEKGEKNWRKTFRNMAGNKHQEKEYPQRRISKAISTALPGPEGASGQ